MSQGHHFGKKKSRSWIALIFSQLLLRDGKKRLQKAAKDETTEQKSRRETATAEKDVGKSKGKKSKTVKIIEVGNKGSALLLEKL